MPPPLTQEALPPPAPHEKGEHSPIIPSPRCNYQGAPASFIHPHFIHPPLQLPRRTRVVHLSTLYPPPAPLPFPGPWHPQFPKISLKIHTRWWLFLNDGSFLPLRQPPQSLRRTHDTEELEPSAPIVTVAEPGTAPAGFFARGSTEGKVQVSRMDRM